LNFTLAGVFLATVRCCDFEASSDEGKHAARSVSPRVLSDSGKWTGVCLPTAFDWRSLPGEERTNIAAESGIRL